MIWFFISLSLLTSAPQGGHTNSVPPGDPAPGYASLPYLPAPKPVEGEILAPTSVNIPSGSSQSALFGIDVTSKDQDTFEENRPTGLVYPVYGTAVTVIVQAGADSGTAIPSGGLGLQAFEYANKTTLSSSAEAIKDRYNYHAVYLHDVGYPLERVLSFAMHDGTPAGPITGDLMTWHVHDTNVVVVSSDITVTYGP